MVCKEFSNFAVGTLSMKFVGQKTIYLLTLETYVQIWHKYVNSCNINVYCTLKNEEYAYDNTYIYYSFN